MYAFKTRQYKHRWRRTIREAGVDRGWLDGCQVSTRCVLIVQLVETGDRLNNEGSDGTVLYREDCNEDDETDDGDGDDMLERVIWLIVVVCSRILSMEHLLAFEII